MNSTKNNNKVLKNEENFCTVFKLQKHNRDIKSEPIKLDTKKNEGRYLIATYQEPVALHTNHPTVSSTPLSWGSFHKPCTPQSVEEDLNRKYCLFKILSNPFLLCPWSVKLANRKYSAAGPYTCFCFLWGTKGWIKIPCGGPRGKNLL